MILAVDIGNTNITIGAYNNDDIAFVSRIATDRRRTADQYAAELSAIFRLYGAESKSFDGGIISSVVPELTGAIRNAIEIITGRTPLILGPGVKTGLNIKIDNPAQLGADLVAGAVGAIHKYELPCLVLDLGTATKISVIDSNAVYRGCTISAGVGISLNALSSGTSQLPAISLEAPSGAIGTNTIASMQAGTVLGTAAMLDGLCERLEDALGEKVKTIVATGGISTSITKYCKTSIINDTNLLFDGLRVIYNKNKMHN